MYEPEPPITESALGCLGCLGLLIFIIVCWTGIILAGIAIYRLVT